MFKPNDDCFEVNKYTNYEDDESPLLYEVSLPHSCDGWMIAQEHTKENAIEKLEAFIKEANEALAKLKSLE